MVHTRLSPYQLMRMTKTQTTNLPDRADVHRPTYVTNDAGGTTTDYTPVYEQIPIYSEPRILREIKEDIAGGVIQSGVRWISRVEWKNNDIRLDDIVIVTESRSLQQYILQVTSLLSPQSYGTSYGFQCILVD
jgi:hypothetical protein